MKKKPKPTARPSKRKSALDEAKPVEKLAEGLSMLFYGRSGTGKTALAGTADTPHLLLDLGERGTDTVANVKGLNVIRVRDWDHFEEIYWELKEEDHGYKTVTIDALPGVQQIAINQARTMSKKGERDGTSQRDMGEATKLMATWLYNYRDLKELGIDVVMIAHDRLRESDADVDDAIAPEMGPNLMPGITKTLLGAVDVVGVTFIRVHTEKKKLGVDSKRTVEYCLRVGPHEVYHTKIRVPRGFEIPEYMVDPTIGKLRDLTKGISPAKTAGKSSAKADKRTIKRSK